MNLSGVVLSGADLSGIDLQGAILHNVNFNNANLSGADFTNATGLTALQIRNALNVTGIVLVNVGEPEDVIQKFVDENDFSLPILRDSQGELWRRTGGRFLWANA